MYFGINLYKKFNKNSLTTKVFDPSKSTEYPPESCGYALRNFKLNHIELLMEIKNTKSKHIENKIPLLSIKGILLSSSAKNILKNYKNNNKDTLKIASNNELIPFNLLIEEGMLDLIAPNYQNFVGFQKAIEELLSRKKNIIGIFKYLEK